MTAVGEIRLDPQLHCCRPELLQTRDLGLRERLVRKLRERCASPECERVAVLGACGETLEAIDIELVGL